MRKYINIDERYGEPVEVVVTDYEELNPEGEFVEVNGQIRELRHYPPYDTPIWTPVAVEAKQYERQFSKQYRQLGLGL